jgi:hypothetical protein
MIDENILENFYEWLLKNQNEIRNQERPGSDGIISYIAIPYNIYCTIREISQTDNLDGILDLFWDEWGDHCVRSYIVHAIHNQFSKKYEFCVDIEFTDSYVKTSALNDPRGGFVSDFY